MAEIRRIRERLWEECDGSAEEMARRQQRVQERSRDRVINPEDWKRSRPVRGRAQADRP